MSLGKTVAVGLAAVVVGVAGYLAYLKARPSPQDRQRAELAKCFTLQSWQWREDGGTAEVSVTGKAGMSGSLALDAVASAKGEAVWEPAVLGEKLERTPVEPGKVVTVRRPMRRVHAGAVDDTLLRVSCRPNGPLGLFGVLEYERGHRADTDPDATPPMPLP